jgi:nicotinic acid mononucleotide adenylyltransferase
MTSRPLEERFAMKATLRVARRVDGVFSGLQNIPFLRSEDKTEFRYFKRLFLSALEKIDQRIVGGEIVPWSRTEIAALYEQIQYCPPCHNIQKPMEHCLLVHRRTLHIGVFIGSFDPFQMTHLETALRFLAKSNPPADIVFVVPEGAYSSIKPGRSDYDYRFDILRRQIEDPFRPFILPINIGKKADTIEIISRLIQLLCGYKLEITHIIGSDVFPFAAQWYHKDLAIWEPIAKQHNVEIIFRVFVVKRSDEHDIKELVNKTRSMGIPVQVDPKPIGTPSSTHVREHGVFTIIFPTIDVIEKLEVVFRYGMHRHWLTGDARPDYEI